jgi:hypothetical protein
MQRQARHELTEAVPLFLDGTRRRQLKEMLR